MKRVFLRAYLHNNLGDDLFVKILTQRYPHVRFYVMCEKGNDLGIKNIPNLYTIHPDLFIRGLNKLGKKLFHDPIYTSRFVRNSDVTIILGGSMFMEKGNVDSIYKSYTELQKHSKKYIIMGSNFGPYTTEGFYDRYKQFFSQLDSICFRDQYSYQLFQDLPNVSYGEDIVFNYPVKYLEKKNKITIIPIDLTHRQELKGIAASYEAWLTKLIMQGIDANYEVECISFCKEQGDLAVIERITKGIESPLLSIRPYQGNIQEIVDAIYTSRYVVSTRFHGLILGILGECKIIPVIYDQKMINVLDDLHYEGISVDLNNFKEIHLYDLLQGSSKIELKERDNHQFDYLDTLLK